MSGKTEQPVIIVRKKKGGGHAGHHGGAWKVAYADFMTAMMAFFLLMWLLSMTTPEQRKGIAEYFAPTAASLSQSGAGGLLGGLSVTSSVGARLSSTSPEGMDKRVLPSYGKGEEGDEETGGYEKNAAKDGKENKDGAQPPLSPEAALMQSAAEAIQKEEAAFKDAESVLRSALAASPALQELAKSILIDRTPEGLRIQIVDRDKFSLFPSSSAIPYERGRDLLRLIGRVIARLPNPISVTGHTDGSPFLVGSGRNNWVLSTERANVSREEIVAAGVPDGRIAKISGLADREPLDPKNPADPINRRISIVLLRMKKEGGEKTPPPNPAAPTATQAPTATPQTAPETAPPAKPAPLSAPAQPPSQRIPTKIMNR